MIDWNLVVATLPKLLKAAPITLGITFAAVSLGIFFGFFVALAKLSKHSWLRLPATLYIEIIRGTPMLLQIFMVWYGAFPNISFLTKAPPFLAGIMALGINSAAYLGEIFRGGILSVDKGQREAALSLGMSNYQVVRYIILPQAFTNSLPAMGNELITLIKDSSLLMVIVVPEILYEASMIAARKYTYFSMYTAAGIVYLAMTIFISRILALLEKRLRN